MTAAVDVRGLVKRYRRRDVNAVDGLSFAVAPGEVFGLLGPNGAGKTTTVGVLTTLVRATSGSATVDGVDVLRQPVLARARLAVVPQRSNLDRALTPRQNLAFHAAYHGFARRDCETRAAALLEEFGLAEQADVKVDWYSGGMGQRLMIARALMHEPRVLFLDEPTAGLDPQARLFVWDRIRDLRWRGVTIVLTTHDMQEAAELADRVGIVDRGRLLALDAPGPLIRGLATRGVLDLTVTRKAGDSADALLAALTAIRGVDRGEWLTASAAQSADGPQGTARASMRRLRLHVATDPAALLGTVVGKLTGRGAAVNAVHIAEPTLQEVFIELTGRGLR